MKAGNGKTKKSVMDELYGGEGCKPLHPSQIRPERYTVDCSKGHFIDRATGNRAHVLEDIVIIDYAFGRVAWEGTQPDGSPPVCGSPDGYRPFAEIESPPAQACDDCPWAIPDSTGKARCNFTYVLACYELETGFPFILRIKAETARRVMDGFASMLNKRELPPRSQRVKLSFTPTVGKRSRQEYMQLEMTWADITDAETAELTAGYQQKWLAEAQRTPLMIAPPPPENGTSAPEPEPADAAQAT